MKKNKSILLMKLKIILDYSLPNFVKQSIRSCFYFFKYSKVKIRGSARLSLSLVFGKNVFIGESCIINGNCRIGDYTFINDYTRIDPSVSEIGKFCSISHNVKIGMRPHPTSYLSTNSFFYSSLKNTSGIDLYDDYGDKSTEIGNDVFIACNAVILAGVKIGTGAVICAGSVVTKDVEPYSIVGGVPAVMMSYRFTPEVIDKLLQLEWWNMDESKLSELGVSVKDIDSSINILSIIK